MEKPFARKLLEFISRQATYTAPVANASEDKPAKKEYKYKAVDVPQEHQEDFKKVYGIYPDDLKKGDLETLAMMESSVFTDERNKGANFVFGKEGWRMGLDKGGHGEEAVKNYTKKGTDYTALRGSKEGKPIIPGAIDASTPIGALGLGASSLVSLKRNNPEMSFEDLYFKEFNANPRSDTPERRQAFRDYSDYYSGK